MALKDFHVKHFAVFELFVYIGFVFSLSPPLRLQCLPHHKPGFRNTCTINL